MHPHETSMTDTSFILESLQHLLLHASRPVAAPLGRAKCAGCGKYGPDRCTCESFRKVMKKEGEDAKPHSCPKGKSRPQPNGFLLFHPDQDFAQHRETAGVGLALSKCLDAVKAQNERQAAVKAAEAKEKEAVKEREARKWWMPVVDPKGAKTRHRASWSWSWAQQEVWASVQHDGLQ